MKISKIIILTALLNILSLLTTHSALANIIPPPTLDQVTFTLTAQEWAKTDKAKVKVAVNATLDKIALAEMREKIMGNLNKIAKGDWHITDFERSQDSSGLEKLYVEAEARIGEKELTNVNAQAQDISGGGVKYKVESIDFTPSVADIEKVKKSLREKLYLEAQNEITLLNTQYPTQKYLLHDMRFNEFMASTGVRTEMMMSVATGARPQANVAVNSVSSLITLTADVNLASERTTTAKIS